MDLGDISIQVIDGDPPENEWSCPECGSDQIEDMEIHWCQTCESYQVDEVGDQCPECMAEEGKDPMRYSTQRVIVLLGILFWILVLSLSVANAEVIIDICDVKNEQGVHDTTEACDGPRWSLIYEFHLTSGKGQRILFTNETFYKREDCLRLGSFVLKQKFHNTARFECIPNRPLGEE